MKKSEISDKQILMTLLKSKIDKNISAEYKRRTINDEKYFDCKSDKDEKSSVKEYFEKFRPRLRDFIDDLKKPSEYKMDVTMKPKFMLSTDINGKGIMFSKCGKKVILNSNNNNKFMQEICHSLLDSLFDSLLTLLLIIFQGCIIMS